MGDEGGGVKAKIAAVLTEQKAKVVAAITMPAVFCVACKILNNIEALMMMN